MARAWEGFDENSGNILECQTPRVTVTPTAPRKHFSKMSSAVVAKAAKIFAQL